ncbi:WD-40 repeat-containing protein [Calothrix brevissima NIES-22]|nr:WD-40 repeat-containing protein [Calothrix brevissima NIES-22]
MSSNNDDKKFIQAQVNWDLERLYDDLESIKEKYFSKQRSILTERQKCYLRALLCKYSPHQIAQELGIKVTTLNVALSDDLYRYIEQLLSDKGKQSIKIKWENISQLLQEAGYKKKTSEPPPSNQSFQEEKQVSIDVSNKEDWGDAPALSNFFGRTQELDILKQWIVAKNVDNEENICRMVAIVGIAGSGKTSLTVTLRGGIGKTDLLLKLVSEIKNDFDYIIWRSLRNSPPLIEILGDIIKFLSDQEEISLLDTVEKQITQQLLKYLLQKRCLVILDNFESVLLEGDSSGKYRQGYEGYSVLLQKIGEVNHKSCLLLTSREQPQEIIRLEGETKPVRLFMLEGLGYLDGRKIFDTIGDGKFNGTDDEWQQLIEFYFNGNPLALELAARHIKKAYNGNIAEFLAKGKKDFKQMREDLLDWHFNQLSSLEKEIVYWLAINRIPISITELQNDITSEASEEVASTIEVILNQFSLEISSFNGEQYFGLQPVIDEYIINKFIDEIYTEILQKEINILNSHALMKALSKDYIRQEQIRLIVKPLVKKLQSKGKKNFENKLKQILVKLQEEYPELPGYAAGNVLNLLCQQTEANSKIKPVLKGYDFSHLVIWQAYLQDIEIHDSNFTNSELDKSVFTQTLGTIYSVAYSPDRSLLAVGDAKGEIRLYRIADGEQISVCRGHDDWVRSIAFSPNGKIIVSGSEDKRLGIWNVNTGQCIQMLSGDAHRIRSVAFSPDGRFFASGNDDNTVKLWDATTGECLKIFNEHNGRVWSVVFSPDGQIIASGSEDKTVKLCNVSTGQCFKTLSSHSSLLRAVAFSPDGQILASGSEDKTVKLWKVDTGECIKTLSIAQGGAISSVAFSADGETLASGSFDRTIRVWNYHTGDCLKTLQGHTAGVWSVAFHPDGQTLASGAEDRVVKTWDVKVGKCLSTLHGYSNWVMSVAFSWDGQYFASGSEDQKVRIWDVQTGQCVHTFSGHERMVWSVAFSPDGKTLVSGSDDNTVKLWAVDTGECITLHGHKMWVRAVAFSPKSKMIASASGDKTIKIWDVSNGQCLKTLEGHGDRVWTVAFSPNGQTVVSGSNDMTVKIWDVSTGQCLKTLEEHTDRIWSTIFTPDGDTVISGSNDQTIKIWDVRTGECLQTLQGHTGGVVSVAVSADGQLIASGSETSGIEDKTLNLKIWKVSNGECLHDLRKHTNLVRSVAFSPDSQILVSSSYDETINFWNVRTGEYLKTLRPPRPYEGMDITGIQGLTPPEKATLKALGAVENNG